MLRPFLMVFALYLALAVLVTWPAAANISGALIGHHTGDAYEMGHHIWWYGYALKHGEPLFTQTLLGYPDGIGGISLWSNPLQFFPASAFALVMPVAAAYNLQVLLTMALNGLTMAFLVTRIGGRAGWQGAGRIDYGPAVIAGAAFLTFPVFQGRLFGGHGGLMVMWPVPLYIDALFSLREGFTRGRFIRAVVWFIASPFGHTLQAIYVLMPVTGLFTLSQLVTRDLRGAIRTVAAALLGAVLLIAIFALPVAADAFGETYTGDLGTIIFSADLLALVTPSFESPIWGGLGHSRAVLGTNLIEGLAYYGIIAALFTALAVWKRRESHWWLLLMGIAAVLSLGPIINIMGRPATLRIDNADTFVTLPWAWIYNLPGFSLARSPGRFNFTTALAIAVMVGIGASVLWQGRRRWLAVALAALLIVDYQSFWPMPTIDAGIPTPILALRERDDVRAVMDMPWGNLLAAKHGMYLQTGHEKPLIAGQVTRRTPVSPAKLTVLEDSLDPALMDAAGVDAVILHKFYDDGTLADALRAAYGAPAYEDAAFALYDVPDVVYPAAFHATGTAPYVDFTGVHTLYFYAPEDGLYTIDGIFSAPAFAPELVVTLDGTPIRYLAGIDSPFDVPLFVSAGYHTVTIGFEAYCPSVRPNPALTCPSGTLRDLQITPQAAEIAPSTAFDGGITLAAAAIVADSDAVTVHLRWQFDGPRSSDALRFVKLLTPDGEEINGIDGTPQRSTSTSATAAETLVIPLPDDFTGRLEVYVGWYSYPDIVRFPVHSDGKRAQDGLLYLGMLTFP